MSEQQSSRSVRWVEGPEGYPLLTNRSDEELRDGIHLFAEIEHAGLTVLTAFMRLGDWAKR